MITSADTNIFVHAANPLAKEHTQAAQFLSSQREHFTTTHLVLVEIYMQLRNKAIFKGSAFGPKEAKNYCLKLAAVPFWTCVDYAPEATNKLWDWAETTTGGFRKIIDARIALTLRHHGVTHFATANVKDFQDFGFERVWNPLEE